MHLLQRRYWWHVRRSASMSGHLWQGRYHSFPIETEAYVLEAARYIERNPLEAGLVSELLAFPWSSYGAYAAGQASPLPLHPTPVYIALGTEPAARHQCYRRFVETPQPYDKSMRRNLRAVTSYA